MANPYRDKAAKSSQYKMRAITGVGGYGSPFMGMSKFKKAGKDGIQNTYNAHAKNFVDGSMPKRSGFKSGGRAKATHVTVNVNMPKGQQGVPPGPPPMPPPPPPGPPGMGLAGGMPAGGAMGPTAAGANPALQAMNTMQGKGPMGSLGPVTGAKRGGRMTGFGRRWGDEKARRMVDINKGNAATTQMHPQGGYDIKHWKEYAAKNQTPEHRALGGRTHLNMSGKGLSPYGAESGMGRLWKYQHYRRGKRSK